jgi:hypothetical protein
MENPTVMEGLLELSAALNLRDAEEEPFCPYAFAAVIDDICRLSWENLDADEIIRVAKAYYYFSIQFRENLEIACKLYPHDAKLQELRAGECDTDNLSPWPDVAERGEKLNHDEFVRRLLSLQATDWDDYLSLVGEKYLERARELDNPTRARSIASYEDGGLSRVFMAILRAPHWRGAAAGAFKFFLEEHIRFDTDDDGGHGALSRHLKPDDKILPLWIAFRELLITAAPRLAERPGDHRRMANPRGYPVAVAAE